MPSSSHRTISSSRCYWPCGACRRPWRAWSRRRRPGGLGEQSSRAGGGGSRCGRSCGPGRGAPSIERVLAQEDEPPFGEDETVFSQLALATDEERRLSLIAKQAEAYGALIRAGVEPDAGAAATGFDPAQLRHTGPGPG